MYVLGTSTVQSKWEGQNIPDIHWMNLVNARNHNSPFSYKKKYFQGEIALFY